MLGHEGVTAQHFLHDPAERTRALAVDDADRRESGEEGIVQIFFQEITTLFGSPSDQVQLDGDLALLLTRPRCATRVGVPGAPSLHGRGLG